MNYDRNLYVTICFYVVKLINEIQELETLSGKTIINQVNYIQIYLSTHICIYYIWGTFTIRLYF